MLKKYHFFDLFDFFYFFSDFVLFRQSNILKFFNFLWINWIYLTHNKNTTPTLSSKLALNQPLQGIAEVDLKSGGGELCHFNTNF